MKTNKHIVAISAAMAFAGIASASFVAPGEWNVGDAGSTYQQWDVLGAPTNNAPDIGVFSPGSPILEATGGAIATGSGNFYLWTHDYGTEADIYNQSGSGGTHVIVQIDASMNGTDSVYRNSLEILTLAGGAITGGANASALANVVQSTYTVSTPQGDADAQVLGWEFFLPGYTGDFMVKSASIVHSSFKEMRVDSMVSSSNTAFNTTVIPEPATLLLFGGAAGGMVLFRRKFIV